MPSKIYVELLNEGTTCYRPVIAKKIDHDLYVISHENNYDTEDEEWMFIPGTIVRVKMHTFSSGENNLLAIEAFHKDI